MNSILEQYQKQVQNDRVGETYDHDNAENNLQMTDEEYEYYKQTIDDLREQMYENVPKEMKSRVENKSYPKSLLNTEPPAEYKTNEIILNINGDKNLPPDGMKFSEEELNSIDEHYISFTGNSYIKRAYCPYCGEEIITKNPTMYNPFNFEPICIYKCTKCKHEYRIDGSYPRFYILDPNNNSVKLHMN